MTTELGVAAFALLGASSVVALTHLQKRLWIRGYFGLGELLTGFEYGDKPGWAAVLVKLAIPIAAGGIGAMPANTDYILVGGLVGLCGALALCWPVFLSSDAIPDYIKHKTQELRLTYTFFCLAYAAMGAVGGLLSPAITAFARTPDLGTLLTDIGTDLVANALWSVVAVLLAAWYTKAQTTRAYALRQEAENPSWGQSQTLLYPADDDTRHYS